MKASETISYVYRVYGGTEVHHHAFSSSVPTNNSRYQWTGQNSFLAWSRNEDNLAVRPMA
jgi:hypothetical protein